MDGEDWRIGNPTPGITGRRGICGTNLCGIPGICRNYSRCYGMHAIPVNPPVPQSVNRNDFRQRNQAEKRPPLAVGVDAVVILRTQPKTVNS